MTTKRITLALLVLTSPAAARETFRDLEDRVTQLELLEHRRAVEESARLPPIKTPQERAEQERARQKLCGWFPAACTNE